MQTTSVRKRVRRWLGIDGWGWDLLRLKRRVGKMIIRQEEMTEDLLDWAERVLVLTTAHDNLVASIDHTDDDLAGIRDRLEARIQLLEDYSSTVGAQIVDDEKRIVALEEYRATIVQAFQEVARRLDKMENA